MSQVYLRRGKDNLLSNDGSRGNCSEGNRFFPLQRFCKLGTDCDDRALLCRYATDWGMFHFCIANTELDWREGTEQYKFLEDCFASVDRQKQPWLIFIAHRVLGYSSGIFYALEGTFNEPGGRDDLQKLWQKYKVDLAFYGHVHNYERTCPIYQVNYL